MGRNVKKIEKVLAVKYFFSTFAADNSN